MSEDKRLGTNPLNWVAQEPTADQDDSPLPKEQTISSTFVTRNRAEASYELQHTMISIPDTILEEELMSKGKVKIKQTMETSQAVAYLEDLAHSLSAGVLRAENGDDSVVLCTADTLKFEMKLSRNKNKAKCSIEMEWIDDGTSAEGFKISG